jgi:AraC-like DNA-binding protein
VKPLDTFLVILLSIGAVQGIVYGGILFWKASVNKTANRFLATILFFFSYRLFVEILKVFKIGFYDFWYHILIEYNWVYGALIYLFIKAYVTPKYKFKWRVEWIHFLPVLIEFLWSNFIKTQNFYWDGTRDSLTWLGYWGYVVWMHYPTMFVICGLLIVFYSFKAHRLLKASASNPVIISEQLTWVYRVIFVLRYFSMALIVIVLTDLIFFDFAFDRFYNYPLFIGMSLITYWLGIEGFHRRNQVVIRQKAILSDKEMGQLQTIATQLQKLMEDDQLFKDPNLNLASLSKELGVKSYQTTKCLNVIMEQKFSDYVNSFRIAALKSLLQDPENQKYTLLSLAFEVGFNSKASFNRAVKKLTGKPPSDLKS